MNSTKINEEVLYATDDVVQIEYSDIEKLKKNASRNPRKRWPSRRWCDFAHI